MFGMFDGLQGWLSGLGSGQSNPWSWNSINQGATQIPQTDAYKAAFGKQADQWASRGLPNPSEYQAPTGKYNQMAHQGGYGAYADDLKNFQANPLQGQNFNLGGGAMPSLDKQSQYGTGLSGLFNQGVDKLQQWNQNPTVQAFGQGAQNLSMLYGLLGQNGQAGGISPWQLAAINAYGTRI